MRIDRSRFAGLLAAVLVAGAAAWTPSYVGAAQCGSTQMAGGRWSAVDAAPTPSIPLAGPSGVVASSVVGQDRTVVLATDGVSVYRSTDGGCSWVTTFTFGAADYFSGEGIATAYSITNIVNGHSAAPANRQDVYLAISPNPYNVFTMVTLFGAAPPELIAASHDGGQSFAMVSPTPTAAHPLVPECLEAPSAVMVPPTNSRTIYLECSAGLAQGAVDEQLAGNYSFIYRSTDGAKTWSLLALPGYGGYPPSQWFVPGPKPNELWMAGQWSPPSSSSYYLAVWHSTDGGVHWSRSTPVGHPGVGIGSIGLAVDMAPGSGGERVAVVAPVGVFESADAGKHWAELGGLGTSNGTLYPAVTFFLRHTLYVVATPADYGCSKTASLLVRYPNPRSKPVRTTFPARWGNFGTWGGGGSLATVTGATTAFGYATFCPQANGKQGPPKFLSFEVR